MKSIEFYEKSGQIKILFNRQDFSFEDFLISPEGSRILNKMYFKILQDHEKLIEGKVKDRMNKGEVLGYFIKTHFLSPDKSYDVVFLGADDFIKFNLESPKTKE